MISMNMLNKIANEKSGFTLIELLVVIAIIGLLSSVVLTSLNGARVKSKSSVYKTELISLRPAVISFCSDVTLVPATHVPAAGAHPQGVVGAQNCGANGTGTFSITFTGATNGGACTSATMTETSLAFAGC